MTEQAETVVNTQEDAVETVETTDVDAAAPAETASAEESGSEVVAETPTEASAGETPTEASAGETSTATMSAEAETDETTADASESATDSDDESATDQGDGPVVKLLSVGQKVTGTVRRITDFGAFVDIGVGRDGLIHVSELSVRRVGKVTDVLQENQEIEVWIKKLDRDRNRISLTMIEPGTKTIRDLEKDELVKGTVTRILPYGAFVDIGIGRDALLHIREMSEGFVARPEDVVSVGEELEARIIELSRRRQRVDLSIKGLRPEPEVALPPEAEAAAEATTADAQEEDVVDEFADVEVLSPMELAFKRAMEAEGIELTSTTGKKRRNKKGKRGRSIQDEIIARTLEVANSQ
ncbi:MAG: S1 RNA-binding domain-containing protein [Caldilineaceae bacterium]|nr:S1 RNA-binding domain-containing protein [Caldilineaceae bacterium]